MKFVRNLLGASALVSALALGAAPALAGPFILAGTDADDHGSASVTGNNAGWLFMQRAIENLAPGVTNGNKLVVSLGSDVGTTAGNAALSAFTFSSLAGAGWTFLSINGATDITTFFTSSEGAATAGIIMLDSGNNVTGGLDATEEAALAANATPLNDFLGSGGGLFSQANSYEFLTTLLPTVTVVGQQGSNAALTTDGSAAFPGLTNADLSSGPHHAHFDNVGALTVLGVSTDPADLDTNVIIGASGGSISDPTPVPEPATLLLLSAGLASLGLRRRSKA